MISLSAPPASPSRGGLYRRGVGVSGKPARAATVRIAACLASLALQVSQYTTGSAHLTPCAAGFRRHRSAATLVEPHESAPPKCWAGRRWQGPDDGHVCVTAVPHAGS